VSDIDRQIADASKAAEDLKRAKLLEKPGQPRDGGQSLDRKIENATESVRRLRSDKQKLLN